MFSWAGKGTPIRLTTENPRGFRIYRVSVWNWALLHRKAHQLHVHFICFKRPNYFSSCSTQRQILKWDKTDNFHKCKLGGVFIPHFNNNSYIIFTVIIANSRYEIDTPETRRIKVYFSAPPNLGSFFDLMP